MFTADVLDDIFRYHSPTASQVDQYQRLRDAAKAFANVLVANTPPGADQSAAVRKVREAVMTGNAAIALGGSQFAVPART